MYLKRTQLCRTFIWNIIMTCKSWWAILLGIWCPIVEEVAHWSAGNGALEEWWRSFLKWNHQIISSKPKNLCGRHTINCTSTSAIAMVPPYDQPYTPTRRLSNRGYLSRTILEARISHRNQNIPTASLQECPRPQPSLVHRRWAIDTSILALHCLSHRFERSRGCNLSDNRLSQSALWYLPKGSGRLLYLSFTWLKLGPPYLQGHMLYRSLHFAHSFLTRTVEKVCEMKRTHIASSYALHKQSDGYGG